jgi:hypothetical protein
MLGTCQIDIPVKSIGAVDSPTVWIASSDANNRGVIVKIVCKLVACVIAKLLIAKEICSVVKLSDFPLYNTLHI